jgi:hypothetical protein
MHEYIYLKWEINLKVFEVFFKCFEFIFEIFWRKPGILI